MCYCTLKSRNLGHKQAKPSQAEPSFLMFEPVQENLVKVEWSLDELKHAISKLDWT